MIGWVLFFIVLAALAVYGFASGYRRGAERRRERQLRARGVARKYGLRKP